MITIEIKFNTTTAFGTTACSASKSIFNNYRDVENVEEAVEYVKKCFGNKKYSNQCVDFLYYEAIGRREYTVSRFFRFYSEPITQVVFNGKANGDKYENVKFGAKEIKKAYLECAEFALEKEWEREQKEKAEA